jgi:hypothetical protein
MQINDLKAHIDARFDRMENKVDSHLERISKAEASIEWIKGHIKIGTSLLLTALAGMAATIYNYLAK